MSHFTVLVIGDNIEEQLAPYQEYDGDENFPRELLEFEDTEDEHRTEYETGGTEYVIMPDGRKLLPWNDEFKVPGEIGMVVANTHKVPEHLEIRFIPYKETFATFEEYMKNWCGYERDPEKKRYGDWSNPNGFWDWYSVGGRWANFFIPKKEAIVAPVIVESHPFEKLMASVLPKLIGKPDAALVEGPPKDHIETERCAQLQVKDIDFDAMVLSQLMCAKSLWDKFFPAFDGQEIPLWSEYREKYEDIKKAREAYSQHPVVKKIQELDTDHDLLLSGEYRTIFAGGDWNKFVRRKAMQAFSTYAVVKDGKWYAPGVMGWWCMSSDKDEDKQKWDDEFVDHFILNNPPETFLTVVDCHI